jgi:hypothetical protein
MLLQTKGSSGKQASKVSAEVKKRLLIASLFMVSNLTYANIGPSHHTKQSQSRSYSQAKQPKLVVNTDVLTLVVVENIPENELKPVFLLADHLYDNHVKTRDRAKTEIKYNKLVQSIKTSQGITLSKIPLRSSSQDIKRDKTRIIFKGYVPETDKFAYLGHLPEHTVSMKQQNKNAIFYAEGVIKNGGITIGLIDHHGAWGPAANIKQTGKFAIFLTAKAPGTYRPTIANLVELPSKRVVEITKLGWVTDSKGKLPAIIIKEGRKDSVVVKAQMPHH